MNDSRYKQRSHVSETPDTSHIKNIDVTHEESDVNVSAIFKFVLFLTLLTAAVFVLMWGLFRVLNARAQKEPEPGPMAMSEKERLPPEPRLQGAKGFGEDLAKATGERDTNKPLDPTWEIKVLRQQWEDSLEHGLRDPNGNVVGIPIDQAMRMIVEGKALPVRPNAGKPEDYGVQLPTASSSGRVSERRIE